MRLFAGIIAALTGLLAGAAASHAQSYYMGLRGGYESAHGATLESAGTAGQDAAFDATPAAAAALGFEWIDGWRFEGELSWRRGDFAEIDTVPVISGRAEAYAAMFNIYYAFRHDAVLSPYLGYGFGGARLSVDGLAAGAAIVDDFAVAPAWQGMAGIDLVMTPAWKLSLEYRYLDIAEARMTDSLGVPFRMNYRSSAAMLGLRAGF